MNIELGAVYWADPSTDPFGDHARRPVTPVEKRAGGRTLATLTRTTQAPAANLHSVPSPVNPACGLTKQGWWTERHQRPLPAHIFGTDKVSYSGKLPSQEAEDIQKMWVLIKMLGLANQ